MDALDIFEPAGIRFVSVQHEQNAVHMADGYARVLNDRPGVCIAQNGPGITNFVTGVAAAYWAHSPVVVVTPETGWVGARVRITFFMWNHKVIRSCQGIACMI